MQGYSRVGAALHGLRRFADAEEAYNKGLAIEPTNAQLLQGRAECIKAKDAQSADPMQKVAMMFSSPQLMEKIAADPKLSAYLLQPDFQQKIAEIQANPSSLNMYALFSAPF